MDVFAVNCFSLRLFTQNEAQMENPCGLPALDGRDFPGAAKKPLASRFKANKEPWDALGWNPPQVTYFSWEGAYADEEAGPGGGCLMRSPKVCASKETQFGFWWDALQRSSTTVR